MTGLSRGLREVGVALGARATTGAHVLRTRSTSRDLAGVGLIGVLPALSGDLDPDPDEARRWVQDELAGSDYRDQRSILQRLLDWLSRRFDDLQSTPGKGSIGFPPFVIALVFGLVVVGLVVLATRVRRERRLVSSSSATVLGDSTLTAAQLRARAAAALRDGRYDDTVLDTVRAIAREADARTLLSDAPALTAHEIGNQLSTVFPAHATAVTRATDRFDAVAYGRLSATRADVDDVMATDETLRRARPVLPGRPRGGESPPAGADLQPVLATTLPPGERLGVGAGVAPRATTVAPGSSAGAPVGREQTGGPGRSGGADDDIWTTGGGA